MSLSFHFTSPLWKGLLWHTTLKKPRDTNRFPSRFPEGILIGIYCPISLSESKAQSQNSPSIRYLIISSMFYIRAFNGINSAHGVMNSIGLMSINGIIGGQKMGLIRPFLRHRWYIYLTPTNLTPLDFTEMGQTRSWKKGGWHRLLRIQTSERGKRVDHHRQLWVYYWSDNHQTG